MEDANQLLKNRSKAFEFSLVLASVVPFVLSLANNWSHEQPSPSATLTMLLSLLLLLNSIHVPSTLYLYTDPAIRARTQREPWRMAGIPLLIWAGTTLAFYLASSFAGPAHGFGLFLLVMFYIHWQSWHFGMQSYGVHSFVSITAKRPKRAPWQARLEKILVMCGTIFGMMAVYTQLGKLAWFMRLPNVDYVPFDLAATVFYYVGMVGCYVTSLIAIVYLLRYRNMFTRNSAIIFLVSACFFLPDYLPFLPASATPGNFVSVINFTLVHGIQYLVFMVVHVVGQVRERKRANLTLAKPTNTLDPWIMFFTIAVAIGLVINDVEKLSSFTSVLLTALHVEFSTERLIITFIGFSFGLTMAHFWVDQFIWKLSQPEPRAWVSSRYGYVLPTKG